MALGLSSPWVRGILVPRRGIEPTSPALPGRFLTTGPPGKSHFNLLFQELCEDRTIAVVILSRGEAEANLNN